MLNKMKRVFLIVLDSAGIGYEPDADLFGDVGADTFGDCFRTGKLNVPNMRKAGLYNIDGVSMKEPAEKPCGMYGRLREKSMGKDTTVGHWELAGVVSPKPLPTFPNGFPDEVLKRFEEATGRGVLCNKPYSGTQVILDYGKEHLETGKLIVYTSADSVFQIAAHEKLVPPEKLYEYCRIAREILTGKYGVGRVIARPFEGEYPNFTRTANRHDFSLEPPEDTMLDELKNAGLSTIAVGKIYDIFAGKGITEYVRTKSNDDGMEKTMEYAKKDFKGLCFTNLVDFDMKYGHRRDVEGYTNALNRFDEQLGQLLLLLGEDDCVMITADHGCAPTFKGTDHTREYVPLLVIGENIEPQNLGTKESYAFVSELVKRYLN